MTMDYNMPFTEIEFERALAQTRHTAPGPDRVTNEMLKRLTIRMKCALLNLYNQLWEQKTYSEEWKTAFVVPVSKPVKDPYLPSSYRPISLTSCMGKLMEKIVNNRLQWLLEHNSIYDSISSWI